MMIEISFAVFIFSLVILFLVALILIARFTLVASGELSIVVNEDRTVSSQAGLKLLNALSNVNIYLASACGGQGTCGQCRVRVLEGGGDILPTEKTFISRGEAKRGDRLACQVSVKQPLVIEIPAEIFGIKKWICKTRTNRNVTPFIKELVLALPESEHIQFRAGNYVQVTSPPYQLKYEDFDIADIYRPVWDEFNLWRYHSRSDIPVVRAYSLANYPAEDQIIMLDVRIASPPPDKPEVPPGVVSSYIFSLKPDDPVEVTGPYGDFFVKNTDAEIIFIGGGAGMAPMRAHIFNQLKHLDSQRKISFWYGARSKREIFYQNEYDQLQKDYDNFQWYVVLSQPLAEDHWQGYTGYVHETLKQEYLEKHPSPEDCEYYLCGPPMMIASTVKMLDDLGVDQENILFDDFGA